MKEITTTHREIGYRENLEIVARALREQFGIDDCSYVGLALAGNIWSRICVGVSDTRTWGTTHIQTALAELQGRLDKATAQLAEVAR